MEKTLSKLNVVDWSRQKRVELNGSIEPDTRIDDIIYQAVNAMELPQNNVQYGAFINPSDGQRGQKLNKSDTVAEANLEDEMELMIAPEVSAG
jgi:hypothetical protein